MTDDHTRPVLPTEVECWTYDSDEVDAALIGHRDHDYNPFGNYGPTDFLINGPTDFLVRCSRCGDQVPASRLRAAVGAGETDR